MRYTLLMHYPEMTVDELGSEAIAEGMRAFDEYANALRAAGVLESLEVLQQSDTTTTVRAHGGQLQVQDGPYADTKEQLGGTVIIEVPDLEAAIDWARQAPPAAYGVIEIRPSATRFLDGEWRGAASQ